MIIIEPVLMLGWIAPTMEILSKLFMYYMIQKGVSGAIKMATQPKELAAEQARSKEMINLQSQKDREAAERSMEMLRESKREDRAYGREEREAEQAFQRAMLRDQSLYGLYSQIGGGYAGSSGGDIDYSRLFNPNILRQRSQ